MKNYSKVKQIILAICLFILPISFSFGQTNSRPSHKHMIWKVTSPNGAINYLTGSIHSLKSGFYPLDTIFQQVFKKANQIVFEVNFDSAKVQLPLLIKKYAVLPKGMYLKQEVSPHIYTLLKEQLDSLGIPVARFQHFNPIFISIAIKNLKLKKAGFTLNSGIDKHFFYEARKFGKPCLSLETPIAQMKLLFNTSSSKKAENMVKYYIDKANRMINDYEKLATIWKDGNVAQFNSIMVENVEKKNPSLYKMVVVKRNNKWMPEIGKLFNNNKTTWVITGVDHMIGKNGIVAKLRRIGYQVEQL